MNERIKELAEQAGVIFDTDPTYTYGASPKVLERFAELVAAQEREACARLCLEQDEYGCGQYAKAIRARGGK